MRKRVEKKSVLLIVIVRDSAMLRERSNSAGRTSKLPYEQKARYVPWRNYATAGILGAGVIAIGYVVYRVVHSGAVDGAVPE